MRSSSLSCPFNARLAGLVNPICIDASPTPSSTTSPTKKQDANNKKSAARPVHANDEASEAFWRSIEHKEWDNLTSEEKITMDKQSEIDDAVFARAITEDGKYTSLRLLYKSPDSDHTDEFILAALGAIGGLTATTTIGVESKIRELDLFTIVLHHNYYNDHALEIMGPRFIKIMVDMWGFRHPDSIQFISAEAVTPPTPAICKTCSL